MKTIREIIIKVASRCNLNCSYCYMYNKGDYSYKKQPKFMNDDTVDALIDKVKRHVVKHQLSEIDFAFHGGEPLLIQKSYYEKFVRKANAAFSGIAKIYYSLQTNGVLLDDAWCRFLVEQGISVGVSLDGTKEIHDEFRVTHSGKGSYEEVVAGINALREYQTVSIISVVNIEADPELLYNHAKELDVHGYSILLPDATHDHPELQMNLDPASDDAPYGDWLIKLYEIWRKDNSKERPNIQFLRSIMKMLLGEVSGNELIGRKENNALVIQTDGGYEANDCLKVCGDGFTKSGMNVSMHEIDEVLETELAAAYYDSHFNLPQVCQQCPISNICGGGFIAHRYSNLRKFDNPSVYCKDLMKIITHMQGDIIRSLPENIVEELELGVLTYEDARKMLREETGTLAETIIRE